MFRLHKNRGSKSRERFDFKFSQFKALQVPERWEKLFVSVICVETGKTIAKSGKAFVRSGSCQWTDTLTESVWVSKEMEDYVFKIVVSMGSARSGILGESLVNMRSYMSNGAPVLVSLPLKKCNHGTILQVKIMCLTPRTNMRDEQPKVGSENENRAPDVGEDVIKSDEAASLFERSTGSSSSKDLDSTREPTSRESSFYSGSNHSSGSADGLVPNKNSSSSNNLTDSEQKPIKIHNLDSSRDGLTQGNDRTIEHSPSTDSSFQSRITYSDTEQELATPPSLGNTGSSKSLLEAAEDTIQELSKKAKTWERSARNLMLELDIMKNELSDRSETQTRLEIELSASNAERDGLRKEIEELETTTGKGTVLEDSTGEVTLTLITSNIRKEMESEIKYHMESNADLGLHLKRSQDANAELVSVLQELEETIEKQRIEIEDLQSRFSNVKKREEEDEKVEEEEKNVMLLLQQSRESEKNLRIHVHGLEQASFDIERDYKDNLSSKEEEIVRLRAQLAEKKGYDDSNSGSIAEIESLKVKMQELERDCTELTDENLELLFKLRKMKNGGGPSVDLSSHELVAESSESEVIEQNGHDFSVWKAEPELKANVSAIRVLERESSDFENEKRELQQRLSELECENEQLSVCISGLEIQLRDSREERESLKMELDTFKSLAVDLEEKIKQLITESEAQNTEFTKQLHDVDLRFSETLDRCEYLRRDKLKIQNTVENLIQERNSLQRLNEELRKEKLELHEQSVNMEAGLRESEQSVADSAMNIKTLEENLYRSLEDFASREKRLTSDLDAIVDENRIQKEKITQREGLLNRLRLEKTTDVENLKTELETLTKKLSVTQDELERMVCLNVEKALVVADLEETRFKLKETEDELVNLRKQSEEAERNVKHLTDELSALKNNTNGIELKLRVTEYEQQQLTEELKNVINGLETSLQKRYTESENLKAENVLLLERISTLQKSAIELEEYRFEVGGLEEKLHKLEVLCAKNDEVKTELTEIKTTNGNLRQKLRLLEEERDETVKRSHAIEKELKEEKSKHRESNGRNSYRNENQRVKGNKKFDVHDHGSSDGDGVLTSSSSSRIKLLENELAKAIESNNSYKMQLNRYNSEPRNKQKNVHKKSTGEGDNVEVVTKERYEQTKSLLEAELKDIRERYFNMSLKYVEVEARREELVMKIKGTKSVKRWFS